jgi:hypothetical protein
VFLVLISVTGVHETQPVFPKTVLLKLFSVEELPK